MLALCPSGHCLAVPVSEPLPQELFLLLGASQVSTVTPQLVPCVPVPGKEMTIFSLLWLHLSLLLTSPAGLPGLLPTPVGKHIPRAMCVGCVPLILN